MTDDDWTAAAMIDSSLVADLLVHIRQSSPPAVEDSPAPRLKWRVRQRRSKPVVQPSSSSKPTPSPSTPLSWSSGADGVDESSSAPPKPTVGSRSEVTGICENKSRKRSRKKKSINQLKEQEIFVLEERRDLEKKLAKLRVTVEIKRATNNMLRTLKLDLESPPAKRVALAVPAEENLRKRASHNALSAHLGIKGSKSMEQSCLNNPSKHHEEIVKQESKFMLPDLNLPLDDTIA